MKAHRQDDLLPPVREIYEPKQRAGEQCYVDTVRRSNLKFDEEEELVSCLREQLRMEKELEEARTRLAE